MAEMLGDAEMYTLRDVLRGSEYQEALDAKAQALLDHYKKTLEEKGLTGVKTVVKKGHPAEEILNAAREENAEVIVIGSRGKRTSHLFMGGAIESHWTIINAVLAVILVFAGSNILYEFSVKRRTEQFELQKL